MLRQGSLAFRLRTGAQGSGIVRCDRFDVGIAEVWLMTLPGLGDQASLWQPLGCPAGAS